VSDDPAIHSVKQILDNPDWLTNWLTAMAVAGGFSIAASTVKDKLTFTAIFIAFFVACLLAATLWPIMLTYGYGGLVPTLVLAMVCGLGGLVLLLVLISVIRQLIREDGKRFLRSAIRKSEEDGADA